jgi:hypothetical protein
MKKTSIGFAIAALLSDSKALQLRREPLLSWTPKPTKGHPVNYFVPNFGVDTDILDSHQNLKNTEEAMGKPLSTPARNGDGTWEVAIEGNESYNYANVQLDSDLDREPLLSWSPKPVKGGHPVDYFVPHFGVDRDIVDTHSNLKKVETKKGKSLSKPGRNGNGSWEVAIEGNNSYNYANVQLEESREPLLSWSPKPAKGEHPVDYHVADFGIDHDIKDSLSNLKTQENKFGVWTLPKEAVQLSA